MPLSLRTLPALAVLVAAWAALPAQERTAADPTGVVFRVIGPDLEAS